MSLPLDGIKVLEFAEHGFVPSGAAALADWGADVVKLEKPEGDALRSVIASGLMEKAGDFDYVMEIANRNKRNVCLDLRVPEGRELLDRLVAWADVFITNQLPKVLRKYRVESADLLAVNPRLVYARGHGQGARGPDAEAGGFDGVSYWARAGIAHMLTAPGAPLVGSRPAFGDFPSGLHLAGGIAAALVGVLRTGKGITVDVSLLASGIWQLAPDIAATSLLGRAPRKTDTSKVLASPLVASYLTGDGRHLQLVMLEERRYWPGVCRALGREDLIEHPGYATPEKRSENRAELYAIFRETIAREPLAHWLARLSREGCVFAKFASPEEVLVDPQVEANGYLMAHPRDPRARIPATPQQFDGRPAELRRPAPARGEHTDEVLREIGLSPAEIAKLRELRAIA
jgi:crotonobetainyl-CoA:carnitine CoA-transferase CaiB-like acyl-CoA transferase